MKLAIMQPYLFPYLGYFQLFAAADAFVILDDVNFINRGWINRNNLLVNGQAYLFSIPLKEASQNRLIKDIQIADDGKWQGKLLKTIEMNYKKAPHFASVFPLLTDILHCGEKMISGLILYSLRQISSYLALDTRIVESSVIYDNASLKGQEKIMDICLKEGASHYINAIGGMELYEQDFFRQKGMQLSFLKSKAISYPQFNHDFVPWLSVIDVLMFNSSAQTRLLLNEYELR